MKTKRKEKVKRMSHRHVGKILLLSLPVFVLWLIGGILKDGWIGLSLVLWISSIVGSFLLLWAWKERGYTIFLVGTVLFALSTLIWLALYLLPIFQYVYAVFA